MVFLTLMVFFYLRLWHRNTNEIWECSNNDWRKILTNDDCRKLYNYNDAALEAMTIDMNYEESNDAIRQSGMNTAISLKERCKGWYEFSQTELMPIIEEKNWLVHTLRQKVHSVKVTDLP